MSDNLTLFPEPPAKPQRARSVPSYETAAQRKLGLGPEWEWIRIVGCTEKGRRNDAYEPTAFAMVTLRHPTTRATVKVILADAEWR